MPNAATPGGLGSLYRQKALVYTSMTHVFEAEDGRDWERVLRYVEETRKHLADGVRLFQEHLARATDEMEKSRIASLADEFNAMRSSYLRVLESVVTHARSAGPTG